MIQVLLIEERPGRDWGALSLLAAMGICLSVSTVLVGVCAVVLVFHGGDVASRGVGLAIWGVYNAAIASFGTGIFRRMVGAARAGW